MKDDQMDKMPEDIKNQEYSFRTGTPVKEECGNPSTCSGISYSIQDTSNNFPIIHYMLNSWYQIDAQILL